MLLWSHILETKKVGKGGGREERTLNSKVRSILTLKLITFACVVIVLALSYQQFIPVPSITCGVAGFTQQFRHEPLPWKVYNLVRDSRETQVKSIYMNLAHVLHLIGLEGAVRASRSAWLKRAKCAEESSLATESGLSHTFAKFSCISYTLNILSLLIIFLAPHAAKHS